MLYAFDRDLTVETNQGPVALSMITSLRDAGHLVWAIGNQLLVEEAGIPGIKKLSRKTYKMGLPVLGDAPKYIAKSERLVLNKYYRCRMLKALFPSQEAYVVVDDIDLSALESEGWNYYSPQAFVDAWNCGDIHV